MLTTLRFADGKVETQTTLRLADGKVENADHFEVSRRESRKRRPLSGLQTEKRKC